MVAHFGAPPILLATLVENGRKNISIASGGDRTPLLRTRVRCAIQYSSGALEIPVRSMGVMLDDP